MDHTPFGDAPTAVSTIRLVLAFGGIVLALLCARIVAQRFLRRGTGSTYGTDIPTVAYIAFGMCSALPARNGLRRIPDGNALDWPSTVVYVLVLVFGFVAAFQVMSTKRERRRTGNTP